MIRKSLVTVFLGFFVVLLVHSCDLSEDDKQDEQEEQKKNVKLAVFGDSIAVGLFSDSQMGGNESLDHPLVKIIIANDGKAQSSVELDRHYRENVENSFTCPIETCEFSFAKQLEISADDSASYAFIGSRYSSTADGKAVTISQQIAKFGGRSEIYIIEGGANDFCATDYDQDKVKQAVKKAIDEVYAQNAEAKVIVVPVPDILRVFKVAEDGADAFKVENKGGPVVQKCGAIRQNSCPRISDATAKELVDLNGAIDNLVKSFSEAGKKIAVASDVAGFDFEKKHIAADCFHPSQEGLKKIANFTKQAYDSLE